MGILELLLIAVGLAMDAFAVSVCKGLSLKEMEWKKAVTVGLYFGVFQALMPAVGYFLGTTFESLVTQIDHWIAFVLLGFIGINMLKEALDKDKEESNDKVDFKTMFVLAIATSIDALAIGITFAFLKVNVLLATLLIGIITFVLSIIGVKIGNKFGDKYERKAEVIGGMILILMGIKILFEHLGVI
ncbi:MAG: manganese efflux pump [Clostridia bacterium]|nr:manganese efflux pump [Clostridia bacterium]